jgi:hypothetical protein
VAVALVKEGDQWKLDELTDIPEFDFEGFKAAFTEEISADESVPPEVVTCITDSFDSQGPDAVKEAIISGDPEQVFGIFGECVGQGA